MIKTEISLLTNNIILPFQDLQKEHGLEFVELNKLFATQSLAEHGLGFLINIYDQEDPNNEWSAELKKKIIFDMGSSNLTYLHNLDIRGYSIYDATEIVISHWHYDHIGAFYEILERIDDEIPIICHESAKFERFFKRSNDVKISNLKGKTKEEILPLLSTSKIVNQCPIDLERVKNLNGNVKFSKQPFKLLKIDGLKVVASGEIPRIHEEEYFSNYFSLQDDTLKVDNILDDKCLIFEYDKNVILLNGCCHSGLMNTLDYVKEISDKPISHIIGGFHMASASDIRINNTIEYLRTFQDRDTTLYVFPIHCTGEKFLYELKKRNIPKIKAFNASVGTVFNF